MPDQWKFADDIKYSSSSAAKSAACSTCSAVKAEMHKVLHLIYIYQKLCTLMQRVLLCLTFFGKMGDPLKAPPANPRP